MNALLEKAVARIRELPEDRQEELAEIMLDLANDPEAWQPSAAQVAEIELARQEAREGKFLTEKEMSDLWRRFRS